MKKLTLGDKLMMLAGGIGFAASCYLTYEQGYDVGQRVAQDERYCQRQEQMLRRDFSGVHIEDLLSPKLRISCPEVYRLAENIKEQEE